MYSLAAILVSVLSGYSIGSLLAAHLPAKPATFQIIGVCLFAVLSLLYLFLPHTIAALMPLSQPMRIAVCVFITVLISVVCWMPVTLGMSVVREKHGSAVGWMWGVSSGFNALAAISFVSISQRTSISLTLEMAAVLYLVGCVLFCLKGPWTGAIKE